MLTVKLTLSISLQDVEWQMESSLVYYAGHSGSMYYSMVNKLVGKMIATGRILLE